MLNNCGQDAQTVALMRNHRQMVDLISEYSEKKKGKKGAKNAKKKSRSCVDLAHLASPMKYAESVVGLSGMFRSSAVQSPEQGGEHSSGYSSGGEGNPNTMRRSFLELSEGDHLTSLRKMEIATQTDPDPLTTSVKVQK
jgi:hypothetical protein